MDRGTLDVDEANDGDADDDDDDDDDEWTFQEVVTWTGRRELPRNS